MCQRQQRPTPNQRTENNVVHPNKEQKTTSYTQPKNRKQRRTPNQRTENIGSELIKKVDDCKLQNERI